MTATNIPKFAAISASSSGNTTLIAAVTDRKIQVMALTLIAAGDVSVTFRSGAATNLSGALPLTANSGFAPAYSPVGLMETASGEALTLNLSASVQVSGFLSYREL